MHYIVGSYIFTLYMMSYLTDQDNNYDIQANVTKRPWS